MQNVLEMALRAIATNFAADRKGVTAIEYGLIAGLIAVAIIGAITGLGGSLGNLFNSVNTSVSGA